MSEKSAGKSSNDSQSEHEDENVDEKYGEDAPLLEEKQSQLLRINEIHFKARRPRPYFVRHKHAKTNRTSVSH